jgi:predicted GIY-YIG superfamily endonuclease
VYKVYKHSCPNGKVYIGITSLSLNNRWRNGEGYKRSKLFYRAIKKYGWENIKHEILFEDLSKEQAEAKEIELIKLYNSTNNEKVITLKMVDKLELLE